ncbi:MAG: MBL fold metallo-hydrolase [Clostridiales bacterium]|nr:MBL fold metallo-hydrolase [Clostridiales bacterium]
MAKKRKSKKNKNGLIGFLLAIITVLIIAAIVLYIVKPQFVINIYNQIIEYINKDSNGGSENGGNIEHGELAEISSAELSIHFLELGNEYTGDCTLIKVGNTEVLIDAGSRQGSAEYLKSYVDTYCTDGVLEYVIATHADQDHIAAFVGNKSGETRTGLLYQYQVQTLIQFALTNKTTTIYNNFCQAVDYCQNNGTKVYTAKQCWYQTDGAQKQYYLDEENKISLNILYNYYYEHQTSDENDYSVCMLLSQEIDSTKTNHYLFTGDLEEKGEEYLVEYNELPEVELFKAGHHGSKTSSNEGLLSIIKPKHVAVCCCAGSNEYTENNQNTFPTQAFINRVSEYTNSIYVTTLSTDGDHEYTSMNGNIVFYYISSENENGLKLWCSNNTTKLKDTEWFAQNRT